eukprot:bmy_15794T0
MWGFIPKGIAGAFQRGYYWYYNKYFNVKKGSIAGLSMVLAAYVIFNYCCSYKELEHEQPRHGDRKAFYYFYTINQKPFNKKRYV